MPIETAVSIQPLTQKEFHRIDEVVLGVAFKAHNKFGRLFNESVYAKEVAEKCLVLGFLVEREVKTLVYHGSFSREYSIDVLINRGAVMELKAAEELNKVHEAQLLNYLYITNTYHGSLINFRQPSVTRRFISTSLSLVERRRFRTIKSGWEALTSEFDNVEEWIIALIKDWGAFLDFRLYRDAIIHFLGGADFVVRSLPVYSGDDVVGYQKVHLLDEGIGLVVSASKRNQRGLHEHLRRMLVHTRLRSIAWINLNGHDIEFVTIRSP